MAESDALMAEIERNKQELARVYQLVSYWHTEAERVTADRDTLAALLSLGLRIPIGSAEDWETWRRDVRAALAGRAQQEGTG